MSNYLKTESDYIISRKESNLSLTSNKSTNSISNSKSQLLYKNNIFSNMKNVNFNNFSFIKKFNLHNSNNDKKNNPSFSSLSKLSIPLEVETQNTININSSSNVKINDSDKKNKIISDFEFQQLINKINIIFQKIKKYVIDNYPCLNECNLWIKIFTSIYDYIIEKNRNNEYFDLINYILMLMAFSIIILYDITNKNKQTLFSEDMKKILNIHALMSESIYGNSLNNPQINAKDESKVLLLSCKDMNNSLLKILQQYNKVNEKILDKLNKNFKTLKNQSYDNIYKFFLKEIENKNSIQNNIQNENKNYNNNTENSNSNYYQIENNNNNLGYNINTNKTEKSINKIPIKNPYQTYTENLCNNNMNNNQKTQLKLDENNQLIKNKIGTINGVSTFLDNSNNVFLLRKPIKYSKPIKQSNEQLEKKTSFIKYSLLPNYSNIDNSYYSNNFNNSRISNNQQSINQQRFYTEENLINKNNKKILLTPQLTHKEIYNEFNTNIPNNNNNINYNNNNDNNFNYNNNIINKNNNYINNNKINYNKSYSNTTSNITILNNYKQNPYINKTPIRGNNIGQLNISTLKNVSLTPVKNLYNNNSTLIPFPPLKPYTLVLDLDQTLVHVPKNSNSIILRPGLRTFLHSLLPFYELIIFTTGTKEYADQIINFIEIEEKYFSYRLYRQNATFLNENYYKNLNKLGRDIKKIIIVDDKAINIKLQEDNGIIIKPFLVENYNNDYILFDLIRVLIRIAKDKPDDIRERLKIYRDEIYNKISNY